MREKINPLVSCLLIEGEWYSVSNPSNPPVAKIVVLNIKVNINTMIIANILFLQTTGINL